MVIVCPALRATSNAGATVSASHSATRSAWQVLRVSHPFQQLYESVAESLKRTQQSTAIGYLAGPRPHTEGTN